MAIGFPGTNQNDTINAVADGNDQIHIFGEQGNDVIRIGFASQIKVGNDDEVNGHHAYGDHGNDEFRFENVDNVTSNGVRIATSLSTLEAATRSGLMK